jgi:copper oxidase (laccase) domain-containing protein
MSPDFGLIQYQGLELLVYVPWWSTGLIHGMTTRQLSLVGAGLEGDCTVIRAAVNASYLALPLQCHGTEVVNLRTAADQCAMLERDGDLCRRASGDAVAAPLHQVEDSQVVAYGVLTADCVPIIVRGDEGYALIHAGWRGLAGGVIAAAMRYVGHPREALIFACAGSLRYEVGSDVIEAIGGSAVFREFPESPEKYLLDTVATSIRQLSAFAPGIPTHAAAICTISDARFHSHRRDAERAGRCMTFVVPSGACSQS